MTIHPFLIDPLASDASAAGEVDLKVKSPAVRSISLHLRGSHQNIATAWWFDDPGQAWTWIAERIADEFGCDMEDVHVAETDDGDMLEITGRGIVAYVAEDLPLDTQMRFAAELGRGR